MRVRWPQLNPHPLNRADKNLGTQQTSFHVQIGRPDMGEDHRCYLTLLQGKPAAQHPVNEQKLNSQI